MSLLDIVSEKYGAPVRGAKGSKSTESGLKALKALKEPRPTASKLKGRDDDLADSTQCEISELNPESDSDLARLYGDDWNEVRNDPVQLEEARHYIRTAKQVVAGQIPEHFTETTQCKHCGPVRVWPGYPNPTNGCPWCMNRRKGLPIPRGNNDAR